MRAVMLLRGGWTGAQPTKAFAGKYTHLTDCMIAVDAMQYLMFGVSNVIVGEMECMWKIDGVTRWRFGSEERLF